MSPSHRDHRSHGTLGTALLAGACCAGAVAYGLIVAPSMLPPQDVQTTTAMTAQVGPDTEEPEEQPEQGPVGFLQVQVSDRDRAWVQTLSCTGNLEEDSEVCAELARAAEDFHSDTGGTVGAGEGEDTGESDLAGSAMLFTEVREGTVCTDKVYGPQEAAIVGTWEGQEIDTTLTRKGSCEEARWQRLRPLTDQIS
ncbi:MULTISPECIES: hypothetical protein [unclassified Nocardiopsis]|uniref:hypothetical protein n=1 Tax=unclassified Nocardiopsis TaxID=2649073 RepID=UPI0013575B06|nr:MULTISPECIES: hypothetical protein [unclassified Nocardiopsis]